MMNKMDLDITQTIKIIDQLKCQLLNDIAQLYSNMQDTEENTKNKDLEILSDIIIITYLLANKMGISYSVLDEKIANKLKLAIIKDMNTEYWLKDLSNLIRHINPRKYQ